MRATSRTTSSSNRSTSPAAESADAGFATSQQTPRTPTEKGKNKPLPTPPAPATNLQIVESHSASKTQAKQPTGEPQAALEPAANEQQQQQQRQQQGQAEQHIDEPQAGLQQAPADQLAQELDALQQQLNADLESEMAETSRPDPIAVKYKPGTEYSWEQLQQVVDTAMYKHTARCTSTVNGALKCAATPTTLLQVVLDHLDPMGAAHRQAIDLIHGTECWDNSNQVIIEPAAAVDWHRDDNGRGVQPTDAAPARPKNWTVAVELMKLLTPSFQTTQGEKVDRLHRCARNPEQSPKAWYTVWAGHLQAARPFMTGGDDDFTLAAKALGCINGGAAMADYAAVFDRYEEGKEVSELEVVGLVKLCETKFQNLLVKTNRQKTLEHATSFHPGRPNNISSTAGRTKSPAAAKQQGDTGLHCSRHPGSNTHNEDQCWVIHPHLRTAAKRVNAATASQPASSTIRVKQL